MTHTFAFLHRIGAEHLRAFRDAEPAVEFLLVDGTGLPGGIERAQAGY